MQHLRSLPTQSRVYQSIARSACRPAPVLSVLVAEAGDLELTTRVGPPHWGQGTATMLPVKELVAWVEPCLP